MSKSMLVIAGLTASVSLALPTSDALAAAQTPGPSAALFNAPAYVCQTHDYVATTGSDTTGTGSSAYPWATLQHANNAIAAGGIGAGANTCVYVAAGTYRAGVSITVGGNTASAAGYLVYKCEALDACTVTDVNAGGNNGAFVFNQRGAKQTANYVWIDGFTLTAASSTSYGQGVSVTNGLNGGQYTPLQSYAMQSVHHIFVTNNIISGYGQAGVQMNDAEYFFVMHNTFYNNAGGPTSSTQGSGVSLLNLIPLTDYTRTAADGNMSLYGNIGTAFHNVIGYNTLYNNAVKPYANHDDTDGNAIILDTLNWDFDKGTTPYSQGTLVDYNVAFNNGGGCVHVFYSEDVTVANNTCWNNRLDTNTNGTDLAEIDTGGSYNDTVINNIAYSFPNAADATYAMCSTYAYPTDGWRSAIIGGGSAGSGGGAVTGDAFANNLYRLSAPNCFTALGAAPAGDTDGGYFMYNHDAPSYDAKAFKCAGQGELCESNATFKSVGTISMGTMTTKPNGVNFVIVTGSPAIGAGLSETYLPSTSKDLGACASSTQTTCP